MSSLEFKLPDIGEGVHEGEIVRWIVAEGASVNEDDPVVEVMTDKATVEIPAPSSGVVSKHLCAEGDVANVGDVIFIIEGGAAAVAEVAAPVVEAPVAAPAVAAPAAPAPAPAPAASGATFEFKLPDIGEGVHEGEIVRWIVSEGDTVAEDDPVVEVMTDKATVEIPAPASGVVQSTLIAEGDVAKVGDVIFVLATSGGGAAAPGMSPGAENDFEASRHAHRPIGELDFPDRVGQERGVGVDAQRPLERAGRRDGTNALGAALWRRRARRAARAAEPCCRAASRHPSRRRT